MVNYTKKAFLGFTWAFFGALVAYFFGYLLRLLLARNLTVEEYGLIYAVIALFGLVKIFRELGLGEAITKFTASKMVKKDLKTVKEVVILSTRLLYSTAAVTALLGILLAGFLSTNFFHAEEARLLVILFAFSVLLSPLNIILTSLYRGIQRLDLRSFYLSFISIVTFIIAWVALTMGARGEAVMYGYIGANLATYLTFLPYARWKTLKQLFLKKAVPTKKTRKMLLAFSLPVMLTGVAGLILTYTDTVILTLFSSLEQVGIYQAALPTANILMFFVGMLTTVLLPLTAELWEKGQKSSIGVAIKNLYKYVFILLLPIIVGTIVYPDFILRLLFGQEYVVGLHILRVLAGASLLLVLNAVNSATLSGIGMPEKVTKAALIGAFVNLGLNIVLIPLYGGLGAAVSTLIAALIIFSLTTRYLARQVKVRPPFWGWIKTTLCGVVFFLVLQTSRGIILGMNQYLKISIAVVLGAIVYLVAIWILRLVSVKEVVEFKTQVIK